MKKATLSLFALILTISAAPAVQANDGIFGYQCRMRAPIGFAAHPAEKIYLSSDLTMAVLESKQTRSNRDPSYRLAMKPTAPFKEKDQVIFFKAVDREERTIQVLFDLQSSSIILQKDIDSVGEQALCIPTEFEPFDWKDAANALGTARDASEGAIFNEGEF